LQRREEAVSYQLSASKKLIASRKVLPTLGQGDGDRLAES
jgi:hypothetical protein